MQSNDDKDAGKKSPVFDHLYVVEADRRTDILIALHSQYMQRFLSDNNRIWQTAATMIPLSLGSFVALATLDHPSRWQVALFATAGWILITVWVVIADNHRKFAERSEQYLKEIEGIWKVIPPSRSKAPPDHVIERLTAKKGRVRQTRYALWLVVTIGAILSILFWPR